MPNAFALKPCEESELLPRRKPKSVSDDLFHLDSSIRTMSIA
jgi:hypothetical protein